MSIYTDGLKIEDIKIRTKGVIEGLSKDELLYTHIHLFGASDESGLLDGYNLPLTLEGFSKVKRMLRVKKMKKEILSNDILEAVDTDFGEDSADAKWFKFEFTKSPISACGYGGVYASLHSYFRKSSIYDLRNIGGNSQKFKDYIVNISCEKSKENSYSNLIKSMIMFYEADSMREYVGEDVSLDEFKEACVSSILNNYILISSDLMEQINYNVDKLMLDSSKTRQTVEEKNAKIKELNLALKSIGKQHKIFDKLQNIDKIMESINGVVSSVTKLTESNESIKKEIKVQKADVVKNVYASQVDTMVTQVADLKAKLSIKSQECKDLKKDFDDYKANIENNIMEYVNKNRVSSELMDFLRKYLADDCSEDTDIVLSIEDNKVEEVVKEDVKPLYRIGVVVIKEDRHYVSYQDGTEFELVDIPEKVYVAQDQFVVTRNDINFIRATSSRYEDNGISIANLRLGTVENVNPISIRVNVQNIRAKNEADLSFLKIGQVVALGDDNKVVRVFKFVRFGADVFINSIKAKGQSMYFVLQVLPSGLFVRNVETGVEDIKVFDCNEIDIKEHSVIFEKESRVVNAMASSRFYTASDFYKDRLSYGTVTLSESDVKIVKQNGEMVYVKNVPVTFDLEEGAIIAVDEFNNYMFRACTEPLENKVSVSKKTPKQMSGAAKQSVDIVGEVTIVGNPGLQNAYTLAFLKQGYRVNFLDGFASSVDKIMQTAKNSKAVIVVASYSSHENFWGVKDRMKDGELEGVRFISGQEDGANALVRKFTEAISGENLVSITG